MKKFVFLFFVIIVLFTVIFASFYGAETEQKSLFCDKNGDFTILIVSDPQCDTKEQWNEAKEELEILINRSNPDFVLINGDMNSRNQISSAMWNLFISPITSRNINWSSTNGNHDPFTLRYYNMYKQSDECLNSLVSVTDENYETTRPMNYVIPIYSNDLKKIVFAIYGMDTGSMNKYGYEGLTEKQINWYEQQSAYLKSQNNEKSVTSLVCMHIPLTQTIDMFYSSDSKSAVAKKSGEKYNIYGVTNQDSAGIKNYTCEDGTFVNESFIHTTAPQNDRGFFDAVLKNGDVKAIIFGHEHKTNIIGSYKGVLLGFAGKLSTGCYSDNICRGGRVIKFNQNCPEKFTTGWIGSMSTSKDQPFIYFDGTVAE